MRRLRLALVLSLVLMVGTALSALAGYDWCDGDPILNIEGRQVSVVTRVPRERLADLKGPVIVRVRLPEGVRARVVAVTGTDFKEEVLIVRSDRDWDEDRPLPVQVEVKAASKSGTPIPVQVVASGTGVVGGEMNEGLGGVGIAFRVAPEERDRDRDRDQKKRER